MLAKKKTEFDKLRDDNSEDDVIEIDEEGMKQIPRRLVTLNSKWVGKMDNGKDCVLDESFVLFTFGAPFANELKLSNHGFVDVPVGDFKMSRLHENPMLHVLGAPSVHYTQREGKDLCVSKSLASALHSVGLEEFASKIDSFGEEILRGAVVNALERVKEHAKSVLPTWMVIERAPKEFDFQQDLKEHDFLVGVLYASDHSSSHAVTIHGNYVYDANEDVALPLCQEALDYCSSTPNVQSSFLCFYREFLIRYKGNKKQRIKCMTLQK